MTAPIGILWAQFGPYHFARVSALSRLAAPSPVHAIELANVSSEYTWNRPDSGVNLVTLCPNAVAEHLPLALVFRKVRASLARLGVKICFLPSYSPKQSLGALLAAKSLGLRTVMMNESHAGTAHARGVSALLKRRLVALFDAALVGGRPQKRYFASLGIPGRNIFTGYDAVDNDYFSTQAAGARKRESTLRKKYGLPARYFLSLGRFVAKKNLSTLVRAYHRYLETSSRNQSHLVMVGSGNEDASLRSLCVELKLPVYEHAIGSLARLPDPNQVPGVHFYGFRQIDENPTFYALAQAFVLPSLYEEWGLVVNEAMACGLPVIVSRTAGCAEDLLEPCAQQNSAPFPRLCKNGFLFDPAAPAGLSQALAMLDSKPQLRTAMGEASSRIIESFSCTAFARNALLAAKAEPQ